MNFFRRLGMGMGIASFALVFGCSSSQSTTGESGHADSTKTAADSTIGSRSAEKGVPGSQKRKQQGFVTQEDTIEAQVETKTSLLERKRAALRTKKYYSVQVGAFRVPSNADRCQKLVTQRFKFRAVNFYDKAIKMYRVTIGDFTKKKDAFAFWRSLKEKYPKDYADSWVAEMRK